MRTENTPIADSSSLVEQQPEEGQKPEEDKKVEPAQKVVAPLPEQPNLPFVSALVSLLDAQEIESGVRATREGVFVEQRLVPQILSAYQRWLQASADQASLKSEDKVRRKLFGGDSPTLYYVLDGKRCLAGFILSGSIASAQVLKLPAYQANLMDTFEAVHPRDPLLAEIPGLRAKLSPTEGFIIEIQAGTQTFELDDRGLKQVITALRNDPQMVREFPVLKRPLREALPVVTQLFSRARPIGGGPQLLIPSAIRGKEGLRLYRYRGYILVLYGEKRLKGVYEVKGKGYGKFLREELAALVLPDGTNAVRGFDSKASKIQYLGKLWTKGISFHLHLRAYRFFERGLLNEPSGATRLKPLYTVQDVATQLAQTFYRAQPVEELQILEILGARRLPFAKYRRAKGWIFVITDKNVVFSCIRLKDEKLEFYRQPTGSPRDGDSRGGRGPGKRGSKNSDSRNRDSKNRGSRNRDPRNRDSRNQDSRNQDGEKRGSNRPDSQNRGAQNRAPGERGGGEGRNQRGPGQDRPKTGPAGQS